MNHDQNQQPRINFIEDQEALEREWAIYHNEGLPIREIIIGRVLGRPDMPIFWVDASKRPDVADMIRVHKAEQVSEGSLWIQPVMLFAREPFAIKIGFYVKISAPVICEFRLLFDYRADTVTALSIALNGQFGIETTPPTSADWTPPASGDLVRLIIADKVRMELLEQFEIARQLTDLAKAEGVQMAKLEPKFKGLLWLAWKPEWGVQSPEGPKQQKTQRGRSRQPRDPRVN